MQRRNINRWSFVGALLGALMIVAPGAWAIDEDPSYNYETRYSDPEAEDYAYGVDSSRFTQPTLSLPLSGQTSLRLGADLTEESWAALESFDSGALHPDQLDVDGWSLGIGVEW